MSPSDRIHCDQDSLEIRIPSCDYELKLNTIPPEAKIEDAEWLILIGGTFDSQSCAEKEGKRIENQLRIFSLRKRVGLDLGGRPPESIITEAGLMYFSEVRKKRVLNDVHGLMIFDSSEPTQFAKSSVNLVRKIPSEQFIEVITEETSEAIHISEKLILSLELYSSSHFELSVITRFLLLIMAIEVLIEPPERSTEERELLLSFLSKIEHSSLSKSSKSSLAGGMKFLFSESISRTGKQLAKQFLNKNLYAGKTAPSFFTHCYNLRSKIVHTGRIVHYTPKVRSIINELDKFIADLCLNIIYKGV
jgi:hypothetical protein